MVQRLPGSEMLARIIDGSSIPSFVINGQHKVIYWNTAIEALSGIKRERIIDTDEQWRAFYKEKRPTMADLIVDEASADEIESYYLDSYEKSRLLEGAYEAENFFKDLGGPGKWLHFTASPIKDDNGDTIGAIETLEDITERKIAETALLESEKSYRALFEGSYEAIWVHDMDGNIQTANKAASELSGYTIEELQQMNIKSLIGDESSKDLLRKVKASLEHKERIDAPYELKITKKDGTTLITMVTTNLVDGGEESEVIQNTARDVTREKQMEENLRYYLQQITRAQEEERKRIARELHDDTAQLLGSLSRQLDNHIRDEHDDKSIHVEFLKNMQEQLNRGVQAVHRYAQDLRPSLIDDLGLIAALRSFVKRGSEYDEIVTEFEVTGDERRLSPEVELLLFRVIQEALSNIWKHAGATRAHLAIRFTGDKVEVSISDNGTGFELSKTIDHLAQTGKLGLIGMQERARLLGGTLDIESELGKGTRVTISLPY
ncbi:PAS domain S-box protein [Chloroflexota bacterium]